MMRYVLIALVATAAGCMQDAESAGGQYGNIYATQGVYFTDHTGAAHVAVYGDIADRTVRSVEIIIYGDGGTYRSDLPVDHTGEFSGVVTMRDVTSGEYFVNARTDVNIGQDSIRISAPPGGVPVFEAPPAADTVIQRQVIPPPVQAAGSLDIATDSTQYMAGDVITVSGISDMRQIQGIVKITNDDTQEDVPSNRFGSIGDFPLNIPVGDHWQPGTYSMVAEYHGGQSNRVQFEIITDEISEAHGMDLEPPEPVSESPTGMSDYEVIILMLAISMTSVAAMAAYWYNVGQKKPEPIPTQTTPELPVFKTPPELPILKVRSEKTDVETPPESSSLKTPLISPKRPVPQAVPGRVKLKEVKKIHHKSDRFFIPDSDILVRACGGRKIKKGEPSNREIREFLIEQAKKDRLRIIYDVKRDCYGVIVKPKITKKYEARLGKWENEIWKPFEPHVIDNNPKEDPYVRRMMDMAHSRAVENEDMEWLRAKFADAKRKADRDGIELSKNPRERLEMLYNKAIGDRVLMARAGTLVKALKENEIGCMISNDADITHFRHDLQGATDDKLRVWNLNDLKSNISKNRSKSRLNRTPSGK